MSGIAFAGLHDGARTDDRNRSPSYRLGRVDLPKLPFHNPAGALTVSTPQFALPAISNAVIHRRPANGSAG